MPKEKKIKPTVRKKKSGGVTPKTPQTGTRQSTLKLPSKPKRGKVILGGLSRPKGLSKAKKGIDKTLDSYAKKTSSGHKEQSTSAPLPEPRRAKTLSVVWDKKKPRGVVKKKPVIKASTKITKPKTAKLTNVQQVAKNKITLSNQREVKKSIRKEDRAGNKAKSQQRRINNNNKRIAKRS